MSTTTGEHSSPGLILLLFPCAHAPWQAKHADDGWPRDTASGSRTKPSNSLQHRGGCIPSGPGSTFWLYDSWNHGPFSNVDFEEPVFTPGRRDSQGSQRVPTSVWKCSDSGHLPTANCCLAESFHSSGLIERVSCRERQESFVIGWRLLIRNRPDHFVAALKSRG